MPGFRFKRIILASTSIVVFIIFVRLTWFSSNDWQDTIAHLSLPKQLEPFLSAAPTHKHQSFQDEVHPTSSKADFHPIPTLMSQADEAWRAYERNKSTNFRQTLEKYRTKYGRHPPPGFKDWYMFARKRDVFNIDDFDQIMDDLRPFWAVDPKVIRTHAAHMWENEDHGAAVIHIRNHKIAKVNYGSWRTDVMSEVIENFVEFLPDMDMAVNRLDQPRVVVPWARMQALLANETETRSVPPALQDHFTPAQDLLLNLSLSIENDTSERLDAHWLNRAGQLYMKLASQACPPDSPARNLNMSAEQVNSKFKEPLGGLVSNFNLSSDLCTVGVQLSTKHGLLYSASSLLASQDLVPIFGECKVNVNSDILFPANMYYTNDARYKYDDVNVPWKEKADTMIWRGATSGGVQVESNWQTMHRQRLVRLLNGTFQAQNKSKVTVLTQTDKGEYESISTFEPAEFATTHTDVGFVDPMSCVPDCSFYNNVFSWKPRIENGEQFRNKYLIDVDGHSFSGRWHGFLESQSLGFKATIFREWHDSRLFAWRHFVPVDNRYDDLYSLLTYFIGYGRAPADSGNAGVYVPSHQVEAQKLAEQGREWAKKVLRREDIEIYTFRLLLEYARICDDNRHDIGYSLDGSELDDVDGLDMKDSSAWHEKIKQATKAWRKGMWKDD